MSENAEDAKENAKENAEDAKEEYEVVVEYWRNLFICVRPRTNEYSLYDDGVVPRQLLIRSLDYGEVRHFTEKEIERRVAQEREEQSRGAQQDPKDAAQPRQASPNKGLSM